MIDIDDVFTDMPAADDDEAAPLTTEEQVIELIGRIVDVEDYQPITSETLLNKDLNFDPIDFQQLMDMIGDEIGIDMGDNLHDMFETCADFTVAQIAAKIKDRLDAQ